MTGPLPPPVPLVSPTFILFTKKIQKKSKFLLHKICLGGNKCPCTPGLTNFHIDYYFSFNLKKILAQNFLRVRCQNALYLPSEPCLTSFYIFTKEIYTKLSGKKFFQTGVAKIPPGPQHPLSNQLSYNLLKEFEEKNLKKC